MHRLLTPQCAEVRVGSNQIRKSHPGDLSRLSAALAPPVIFSLLHKGTVLLQGASISAVPLSVLANSGRWQTNFLRIMVAVQTYAKVCFRNLSPTAKEEATAETVARACVIHAKVTLADETCPLGKW